MADNTVKVKSRIVHKSALEAHWLQAVNFTPLKSEFIVYESEVDAEGNTLTLPEGRTTPYTYPRFKIGDGITNVNNLPFATDEIITQVLTKALPRVVEITLDVSNWTKVTNETNPNFGYYEQVITLDNITEFSRLDLQPSVDMLAEFKELHIAFVTENNNDGTITIYSVGDMPLKSYTIQATITETEVKVANKKVVGIPVGAPTIKSDWAQTDDTKADFIKNKPSIPSTTNELTNNSGFITKAVNDLTNYYKKSETYTQEEINERLSTIPKFAIEVVNELPTVEISDTTIYLKTNSEENNNLYEEYIYVNGKWELLGTQTINLVINESGLNSIIQKVPSYEDIIAFYVDLTGYPEDAIKATLAAEYNITVDTDLSNIATNVSSTVLGIQNKAYGINDTALGRDITIGDATNPFAANNSVGIGDGLTITGSHSVGIGRGETKIVDTDDVYDKRYFEILHQNEVIDNETEVETGDVSGNNSVAIGSPIAKGNRNINIGFANLTKGNANHAIGYQNIGTQRDTNLFGIYNHANNFESVTLVGNANKADNYANMEGRENEIIQVGGAFGFANELYGDTDFIFGVFNKSFHQNAYAFGRHIESAGPYQTLVGFSPKVEGDTLFAIGDGIHDTKHTAFEIKKAVASNTDNTAVATYVNTNLFVNGKEVATKEDIVGGLHVSDTAPENPTNGMLWVDTSVISTDMIRCYYNSIQEAIDETDAVDNGIVGTYTDSDGMHNVVLLSDVNSAEVISIARDCQIRLNGHKVSFTAPGAKFDITNASTVIFNGTATGSEITMNINNGAGEKLINSPQANLVMNGGTYSMYGTYSSFCMSVDSRVDMVAENCNFIAENDYASNTRTVQITGNCTLENCSVIAKNYAQTGKSIGVYINKNSPDVKFINCKVYADGYGDVNNQAIPVNGVYVSSNSTLHIIGGEFFGTREAISPLPGAIVRIEDSVLTGCQHGGAYISNSDTKIKNTLLKNVNYTGTCGWPGREYYAACYCGGDGVSPSVYFDNCTFDSEKAGLSGVVAKYTDTNVYLSNITFGDNITTDIRCDAGNTVYVGKDVAYDTTSISGTLDTATYADTVFAW